MTPDTQSSASRQHYIDTGEYLPGCHVTIYHRGRIHYGKGGGRGSELPKCGLPVVKYGLCERHLADRVRLGGTP